MQTASNVSIPRRITGIAERFLRFYLVRRAAAAKSVWMANASTTAAAARIHYVRQVRAINASMSILTRLTTAAHVTINAANIRFRMRRRIRVQVVNASINVTVVM